MHGLIGSSRGSALLMTLLLSGFLLAVFTGYSTSLRDRLRGEIASGRDTLIALDDASRAILSTGIGVVSPREGTLTGVGEFVAFSGSTTAIPWTRSGALTLTLLAGSAYCYETIDTGNRLEGCSRAVSNITVSDLTGDLSIRTLGGWSRVQVTPASSVTSPSIKYHIFEQVGNLLLLTKTLHLTP